MLYLFIHWHWKEEKDIDGEIYVKSNIKDTFLVDIEHKEAQDLQDYLNNVNESYYDIIDEDTGIKHSDCWFFTQYINEDDINNITKYTVEEIKERYQKEEE